MGSRVCEEHVIVCICPDSKGSLSLEREIDSCRGWSSSVQCIIEAVEWEISGGSRSVQYVTTGGVLALEFGEVD